VAPISSYSVSPLASTRAAASALPANASTGEAADEHRLAEAVAQLAVELVRLPEQRLAGARRRAGGASRECASAIRLSELVVRPGEHAGCQQRVVAVADLPAQALALLPELPCLLAILIVGGSVTEEEERAHGAPAVFELTMEVERLGPKSYALGVRVVDRHVGGCVQGLGARCGRAAVGGEGILEAPTSFGHVALRSAVVHQRSGQPEDELRLARGFQPVERRRRLSPS
jgi:hypothetical protein